MRATIACLTNWIDSRLQRKLILILGSTVLISSITYLFMVVSWYEGQLLNEKTRASLQVNRLLQTSLENAMLKRDIDGLRAIVEKLGTQQDIVDVMILNPKGEVRFSSNHDRLGETLSGDIIAEAIGSKSPRTTFMSNNNGIERLRSVNPVPNRPACLECHGAADKHPVNGLLIVDYDARNIKMDAFKSAVMLGGLGATVIFSTGLGIWAALRRLVLSRVHKLQEASQSLADGKLHVRAELMGRDELTELGNSFDNMAVRLGRMLEELNSMGDFLQSVIDSIPDGIRVIDNQFNIIKANKAYCQQSGRTTEQTVGKKCYQSSHNRKDPCPATLVSCPMVELNEITLPTMKSRHQHIQADGGEIFVEVSAALVNLTIDRKVKPCVIESIRNLEEQAVISHEQRLSEIGLLAAGVAHEIHNPLTSLQLALKAIQQDSKSDGTAQNELEYLEIAELEIAKCIAVTDGLMKLSEPPGETQILVDLGNVISEVSSLLSYEAEQTGVIVKLDLPCHLRVVASDSDMRMIVVNLMQNAFHAMRAGGNLTITGCCKGCWIELVFGDTGCGIPKSNLEKIFLPFWTKRIDTSTGRGLGLSICKAIVDRLGGRLDVQSTVNVGTNFTVLLPSADMDKPNI